MEEVLLIEGFEDYVILEDKETEHFNYMRLANCDDDDILILGDFLIKMDEVKKLLNNEYLNEIDFEDEDELKFNFFVTLNINKKVKFYIKETEAFRFSNTHLAYKDEYISNLIKDILELKDNTSIIEQYFIKKLKKEQPFIVKFLSENDDRSENKIIKMIKKYNRCKNIKKDEQNL